MKYANFFGLGSAALLLLISSAAVAEESLFGYMRGAETLPQGARELVHHLTRRWDKGAGEYTAYDSKIELEYGVTDRFSSGYYLLGQSVNTRGLLIDAYIPKDESSGLKLSGFEVSAKYNFLSPVTENIGLSAYVSGTYMNLDATSGQKKDRYNVETWMMAQKNFLDDQLVWVGNLGLESTYAHRKPLDGLPAGFEWPAHPEMEIAILFGSGVSYRVAPNWFVGAEALYASENETVVGEERWSLQAGPNIHYAEKEWWFTLSWMPQLRGGGGMFPEQNDTRLHLIEKTKQELRLIVGYEF